MINAIMKRSSIRKYKQIPLKEEMINQIKLLIANQKPLFSQIKYKIDLVLDGPSFHKVLGGVIGNYGKVYAPHYLIASTENKENSYENIGYILEYIVLKLTEMNIGTCWIGGGIKKDLFAQYLQIDDELSPVVVIAFGYPESNDLFRNEILQFKRKNLDDLYLGEYKTYQSIMNLVRLAPSSVNLQPWRYEFTNDQQVNIYRVKHNIIMKKFISEMNCIDLGISICHFEIGACSINRKLIIKNLHIVRKGYIYFKTFFIDYDDTDITPIYNC